MTGLVPESYETYQIVQPGDIIIRGTDLQNDVTSLRTGLSKDLGIITSAYINLRPKSNAYAEFLHYLLHSYDVKKVFYGLGSGLRQNLSYVDFKYLTVTLPSLPEQCAIVDFLDDKCAKIDEAVKIKEDQIALLRERRQIIIQEAVTRGLNPAAPMKDSGIDWIGQIPAHWEVKPLKRISEAYGRIGFRGYSTTDLVDAGEGAITLSPSNLSNDEMGFGKCTYLSWPKYHESPEIQIFDGDILIVKTGSTYGKTGFVRNLPQPATINPQLLVLKNVRCKSEFLYHFISSPITQSEIKRRVIGSTIPTISETRILGITIPLPPITEQQAIVTHIDDASQKIEEGIAIKEHQIAALKEYKTSLINAAVTGKIKVI